MDETQIRPDRTISRRAFLCSASALTITLAGSANPKPDTDRILIPAGPFIKGTSSKVLTALAEANGYHPSWFMNEAPRQKINLPEFAIDRYPVTNKQYEAFVQATDHSPPPHFLGKEAPPDLLNHPVVFVNRDDARAYALWAGGRLPTEAEWEKAARGPEGRIYPWGEHFSADLCCWNRLDAEQTPPTPSGLEVEDDYWVKVNVRNGIGTQPVGKYPDGKSPYGVMDMAGNVGEWCEDPDGTVAWIKGGCWLTEKPIHLRAASRSMSGYDSNVTSFYGFRCAWKA